MRLALLGNSGSGKSTLARWACATAGVPGLDLDTVAWEPGQVAVAREPQAAEADVAAFCDAHPAWVVEGCYANLIAVALRRNPRLILLDPRAPPPRRGRGGRPGAPPRPRAAANPPPAPPGPGRGAVPRQLPLPPLGAA